MNKRTFLKLLYSSVLTIVIKKINLFSSINKNKYFLKKTNKYIWILNKNDL